MISIKQRKVYRSIILLSVLLSLSALTPTKAATSNNMIRPRIRPSDTKTTKSVLTTSRGGATSAQKDEPFEPSWEAITALPIRIQNKEQWDAIPASKRVGMMIRPSVLHLTILSSIGPLILRGAARSASGETTTTLRPLLSLIWTISMTSWHAMHNMLNDYQDIKGGDDTRDDSFRLSYGVHALQQKFVTEKEFFKVMLLVALPGILTSVGLHFTDLSVAFPWGLAALALYTPLFKPFALGEVLVYFVWGPLMAGFGEVAATAGSSVDLRSILTSPIAAFWGAISTCVIMGKHTDKIGKSSANTIPSLLGYGGGVLTVDAIITLLPYVILIWALSIGRVGPTVGESPIMPLGASLAFIAFFNEGLSTLRLLSKGEPKNGPTLDEPLKGTINNFNPAKTWPLWFVATMAWNSITVGYLAVYGAGFEWAIREGLKILLPIVSSLLSNE